MVKMFKRPVIRARKHHVDHPTPIDPTGPGIVCNLISKMNMPVPKYIKPEKREYIPPVPPTFEVSKFRTTPLEPVCVRLLIVGGIVKVKLDTKMYALQSKYFSKGQKPPLMEYLRALAAMGYNEAKLNQVSNTYAKWDSPKYQKKLDEEMERLWPSSKAKRRPAPVKKVLKAVKKLS
jgi:hypothetical protein